MRSLFFAATAFIVALSSNAAVAKDTETEIEAVKKKNAELQHQIDLMKERYEAESKAQLKKLDDAEGQLNRAQIARRQQLDEKKGSDAKAKVPPDSDKGAQRNVKNAEAALLQVALSAYRFASKEKKAEILKLLRGLLVTDSIDAVVDLWMRKVAVGETTPEQVSEFFEVEYEKFELARMLSDPRNRSALGALTKELALKNPGVKRKLEQSGDDFRKMFEALNELRIEHLRLLSAKAQSELGSFCPEEHFVRDRIALVFVVDPGDLEGTSSFRKTFKEWICAAAPDGECSKWDAYEDWTESSVHTLMERAEEILLDSKSSAAKMPACPARLDSVDSELNKVLCAPQYMGVMAVVIHKSPQNERTVTVSWRISHKDADLSRSDKFPSQPFVLGDANRLAVDTLVESTISKRISAVVGKLKGLDPVLVAKLAGTELPCPACTNDCSKCDRPPPRNPSAWNALLLPGAPFLQDDSPKNDTWGWFYAGADILGLACSGAFAIAAVDARNRAEGGGAAQYNQSQAFLGATYGCLGLSLASRVASGIHYALTK